MISTAAVDVTVAVHSLVSEPEKLRRHLLGPDFFDASVHPQATFRSTSITGARELQVSGDMTLRGTTRPISFPAEVALTPPEARARAVFSINRQDFGIVYPGKPDDLIADAVALTVELVAPR
jgi:polyisoprenoid-binding protein YceI